MQLLLLVLKKCMRMRTEHTHAHVKVGAERVSSTQRNARGWVGSRELASVKVGGCKEGGGLQVIWCKRCIVWTFISDSSAEIVEWARRILYVGHSALTHSKSENVAPTLFRFSWNFASRDNFIPWSRIWILVFKRNTFFSDLLLEIGVKWTFFL